MNRCRWVAALWLMTVPALSGVSAAHASAPTDWSAIPAKTITLFHPGQSSYRWLRSSAHRYAYRNVRGGQACRYCHEGEERDMGELLVAGGPLEPLPIAGKNGVVDLRVQVAYDAERIHWRFHWKTNFDRPGQMHSYMRFDGNKWAFYGGPRSNKAVREGTMPPLYEDRVSMMIDDGSVSLYDKHGCWLTCHDGERDMPDRASRDTVKAHPLLGKALKKSDVRKYLPASRTDVDATWESTKSAEAIAGIKEQGGFLDLMQWRGHRSNPIAMADDGHVLEYRLFDQGKGPFSWNVDRKTMTPKHMFDEAKVGLKSITVADIADFSKPYAVIREENAVPYDSEAGWAKDDVLPGRLLSREDATGSAADNREAHGVWADGAWTVVWSRALDTGHPRDDKILKEGSVYTISFAVHDDNVTTRFHHVSFPFSLGIGVEADIEAVKVE